MVDAPGVSPIPVKSDKTVAVSFRIYRHVGHIVHLLCTAIDMNVDGPFNILDKKNWCLVNSVGYDAFAGQEQYYPDSAACQFYSWIVELFDKYSQVYFVCSTKRCWETLDDFVRSNMKIELTFWPSSSQYVHTLMDQVEVKCGQSRVYDLMNGTENPYNTLRSDGTEYQAWNWWAAHRELKMKV